MKNFFIILFVVFIFFFKNDFLLADEKNQWKRIDKSSSRILINSNIVFKKKINFLPTYESIVKWKDRNLASGEEAYWVTYSTSTNDSKLCNEICFSISYYEVEKSTWIADIHSRYSPKHSIKYFYDEKSKMNEDYSFTSKLKGFKSINDWFSYLTFVDEETQQNCFIFGTQWHHGYDLPYAILDGIFCKSKELKVNTFVESEIKKIIVNIGIKNLRDVPLDPYFRLKNQNNQTGTENIISIPKYKQKEIFNNIVGQYAGHLIYKNGDKLPVVTEIFMNENSNIIKGKYSFQDFGGEMLNGTLSNFKLITENQITIDWRDTYGRGWLKVEILDKINEFIGKWGIKENNNIEEIGSWNGKKVLINNNDEKIFINNDDSIKNKLKKLKKFYDDGLITLEEYNSKKKLLLDTI